MISVRLQLFLGPDCIPATWHVKLAVRDSIVVHRRTWGHYFRYLDERSPDGYDGVVEPLSRIWHTALP